MSSLKDLVSKGVRLIVTESDEAQAAAETPTSPPPPPRGARPREIAAEDLAVEEPPRSARSELSADVGDLGAVYDEAGIAVPASGYGVQKVAEMLENKRLATMTREVKAAAVLAALETAGASITEVVQDAVRRDNALDAFEADKHQQLQELKARTE